VLHRLRIENLALIREAELELGPGLTAITGETGAGKTILAQAVGLLLGVKGDAGFIGADAPEAYVEAELDLPDGFFEEEGLQAVAELRPDDEDGIVLARRIFPDGRTRAYVWGRSAAREDLAAVGERLIAMSGQFQQRRLAQPAYHLDVLDAFVGEEQPSRAGDIHVVDVTDFNNPREVAVYNMAGQGVHNFSVDEQSGVLYAAYYEGGVVALDIRGDLGTCPQSQRAADGRCDLDRMGRVMAFALRNTGRVNLAIWGVHWQGNYLYASDMQSGIWKVNVSSLRR